MLIGSRKQNLFAKKPMHGEASYCVYCGDWYECIDHRVPIDWPGNHRSYAAGDIVSACRECSLLLSDFPKLTLSSRAGYLIAAYRCFAHLGARAQLSSERPM
jgi:hypothetical protein